MRARLYRMTLTFCDSESIVSWSCGFGALFRDGGDVTVTSDTGRRHVVLHHNWPTKVVSPVNDFHTEAIRPTSACLVPRSNLVA
jgi:hypothetical protein